MKTLNQILQVDELYKAKSPDEDKFVKKHVVIKHKDANGNGDDVFNASKIKTVDREKERHGHSSGKDEEVYESNTLNEKAPPGMEDWVIRHKKDFKNKSTLYAVAWKMYNKKEKSRK